MTSPSVQNSLKAAQPLVSAYIKENMSAEMLELQQEILNFQFTVEPIYNQKLPSIDVQFKKLFTFINEQLKKQNLYLEPPLVFGSRAVRFKDKTFPTNDFDFEQEIDVSKISAKDAQEHLANIFVLFFSTAPNIKQALDQFVKENAQTNTQVDIHQLVKANYFRVIPVFDETNQLIVYQVHLGIMVQINFRFVNHRPTNWNGHYVMKLDTIKASLFDNWISYIDQTALKAIQNREDRVTEPQNLKKLIFRVQLFKFKGGRIINADEVANTMITMLTRDYSLTAYVNRRPVTDKLIFPQEFVKYQSMHANTAIGSIVDLMNWYEFFLQIPDDIFKKEACKATSQAVLNSNPLAALVQDKSLPNIREIMNWMYGILFINSLEQPLNHSDVLKKRTFCVMEGTQGRFVAFTDTPLVIMQKAKVSWQCLEKSARGKDAVHYMGILRTLKIKQLCPRDSAAGTEAANPYQQVKKVFEQYYRSLLPADIVKMCNKFETISDKEMVELSLKLTKNPDIAPLLNEMLMLLFQRFAQNISPMHLQALQRLLFAMHKNGLCSVTQRDAALNSLIALYSLNPQSEDPGYLSAAAEFLCVVFHWSTLPQTTLAFITKLGQHVQMQMERLFKSIDQPKIEKLIYQCIMALWNTLEPKRLSEIFPEYLLRLVQNIDSVAAEEQTLFASYRQQILMKLIECHLDEESTKKIKQYLVCELHALYRKYPFKAEQKKRHKALTSVLLKLENGNESVQKQLLSISQIHQASDPVFLRPLRTLILIAFQYSEKQAYELMDLLNCLQPDGSRFNALQRLSIEFSKREEADISICLAMYEKYLGHDDLSETTHLFLVKLQTTVLCNFVNKLLTTESNLKIFDEMMRNLLLCVGLIQNPSENETDSSIGERLPYIQKYLYEFIKTHIDKVAFRKYIPKLSYNLYKCQWLNENQLNEITDSLLTINQKIPLELHLETFTELVNLRFIKKWSSRLDTACNQMFKEFQASHQALLTERLYLFLKSHKFSNKLSVPTRTCMLFALSKTERQGLFAEAWENVPKNFKISKENALLFARFFANIHQPKFVDFTWDLYVESNNLEILLLAFVNIANQMNSENGCDKKYFTRMLNTLPHLVERISKKNEGDAKVLRELVLHIYGYGKAICIQEEPQEHKQYLDSLGAHLPILLQFFQANPDQLSEFYECVFSIFRFSDDVKILQLLIGNIAKIPKLQLDNLAVMYFSIHLLSPSKLLKLKGQLVTELMQRALVENPWQLNRSRELMIEVVCKQIETFTSVRKVNIAFKILKMANSQLQVQQKENSDPTFRTQLSPYFIRIIKAYIKFKKFQKLPQMLLLGKIINCPKLFEQIGLYYCSALENCKSTEELVKLSEYIQEICENSSTYALSNILMYFIIAVSHYSNASNLLPNLKIAQRFAYQLLGNPSYMIVPTEIDTHIIYQLCVNGNAGSLDEAHTVYLQMSEYVNPSDHYIYKSHCMSAHYFVVTTLVNRIKGIKNPFPNFFTEAFKKATMNQNELFHLPRFLFVQCGLLMQYRMHLSKLNAETASLQDYQNRIRTLATDISPDLKELFEEVFGKLHSHEALQFIPRLLGAFDENKLKQFLHLDSENIILDHITETFRHFFALATTKREDAKQNYEYMNKFFGFFMNQLQAVSHPGIFQKFHETNDKLWQNWMARNSVSLKEAQNAPSNSTNNAPSLASILNDLISSAKAADKSTTSVFRARPKAIGMVELNQLSPKMDGKTK